MKESYETMTLAEAITFYVVYDTCIICSGDNLEVKITSEWFKK